ncbi:hypothetical protein KVT40_003010 [Elsinoe batatas]|uniref:GH16 domain-containing protein n=1 Tax=Elsinoe batatas TaxID=2601811 RepID=A0A8K0PEF0_9PEZI|nr:hypothetical protein KVT40_003010 [Elsinoe batatas]
MATPVRQPSPDNENSTSARTNPFTTPAQSMPASAIGSTTASSYGVQPPTQRYFHSRRVKKGEVEKPWLDKVDPKEKWVTIIPAIGILAGLAVTGFLVYDGLRSVAHNNYCPVLMEDWSKGWNPDVWTKEVELGGYGNGQFEQTTATQENVFVQDGMLYIKPTLQDASLIEQDSTINLLADGTCTSTLWRDCVVSTNTTNGTIVNPVKSGRINTKLGANIKFGKVEVEAKLPAGDWLWPAIWMMPTESVYGVWPRSGEIDIMESRGNNYTHPQGGNNVISSTLHWGPVPSADGWFRNNVKRQALHTTYAKGFHTFGVEWSEKYMFSYIDTRLLQVMYVNFDTTFWERGNFPAATDNGTALINPWGSGTKAAPFDQNFFLIINVAVGGTNGWFGDGFLGKPWVDLAPNAKQQFWEGRDQWYPTWQPDGQLIVKNVKIWQQQGHNGC